MSRQQGNKGEDLAAGFLEHQGVTILERNYYIRGGEIDIIFQQNDVIVFCEVKMRSTNRYGMPCEFVNYKKQQRICKAALDYSYKNKIVDVDFRFDIIEVMNGKINHIRNAFEFIAPQT